MKKILIFLFTISQCGLSAQTVEVQLFQNAASGNVIQTGIRARAVSGTVDYIGVTFYIMYQSANAVPQSTAINSTTGVDDSKLVTTFGWGTSTRFTNPAQPVNPAFDPAPAGGQTYDTRFVYGNSDESTPANTRILTTNWDTLLYINFNTLQFSSPEGGYAYLQQTAEATGSALTDASFANIPFIATSGEVPLGANVLPVLFTRFEAVCSNNEALISWSTGSEFNSNHFEVQRSTNNIDWASIATIKATGNASTGKSYQQFVPNIGLAFYRVREVDVNGNVLYTNILKTNCVNKNDGLIIYPIPARDILNVIIRSGESSQTKLILFDVTGRIMRKMDVHLVKGSNSFIFNLEGLANGHYLILSNNAHASFTSKFNIDR